MSEKYQSNLEKYKLDVIENVGEILVDQPWHKTGSLFLGSGTIRQHRGIGYTYGPRLNEETSTRYLLGMAREQAHVLTVESPEGQDTEGFAAVTTSYSVNLQNQEITVRQWFGDYARNRFYDEEWVKEYSPVYGIDKKSEETQWQALAELTGKLLPRS